MKGNLLYRTQVYMYISVTNYCIRKKLMYKIKKLNLSDGVFVFPLKNLSVLIYNNNVINIYIICIKDFTSNKCRRVSLCYFDS